MYEFAMESVSIAAQFLLLFLVIPFLLYQAWIHFGGGFRDNE